MPDLGLMVPTREAEAGRAVGSFVSLLHSKFKTSTVLHERWGDL